MSKAEIEEFFSLCKTQCKGYLSMSEFNELYKNPKADDLFRFFVKRSRKINEELMKKGVDKIYLPFNLSRFLESIAIKARRETVT
jgi:hypothetical protein